MVRERGEGGETTPKMLGLSKHLSVIVMGWQRGKAQACALAFEERGNVGRDTEGW